MPTVINSGEKSWPLAKLGWFADDLGVDGILVEFNEMTMG
jgi:hypothetical protein